MRETMQYRLPSTDGRRAFLSVVAASVAGCLSTRDDSSPTSETSADIDADGHPSLESQLYNLTTADDPETAASRYGIELEDGTLPVQITVSDASIDVPEQMVVEITSRFETRRDAIVAVDRLLPLADRDDISFISYRSEPQQQTGPDNE